MEYVTLAMMAVMTAGGVWFADRWLGGRKWAQGCFFGLLAVIANTSSVLSVSEFNIALSLRDAPVIAASLFFGPVPGIIAGFIAGVERAITPFFGVGAASLCPLSTFIVGLVSAAVGRWFMDGRRPYLLQAFLLGIILQAFHLSLDVFFGLSDLSRCCEIIFEAFAPECLGIALALSLSCAALKRFGGLRAGLRSRANLLLFAYLACCSISIGWIMYYAEIDSRRMCSSASRRLEQIFECQIDFILHQDALWVAERLESLDGLSRDRFDTTAKDADYDELNAVRRDGKVCFSMDPAIVGVDFNDHPLTRQYLALNGDPEGYVSEQFRYGVNAPDPVLVKYVGVPMPDDSGFIQLGFYRSRLEREFRRFFFPLFNGVMNFFENDYNVIVSTNDYRVAIATGGHADAVGCSLDEIGVRPDRDHARLFGEWCHIGVKEVGEWRIYCIVPLVESYGESMVICSVLVVLLFVLVFGFRVVMLRFRRQQSKIDRMRAEADAKRRQDMEIAAKIQGSSLPVVCPEGEGFRFSARMKPAMEVGGDFYDFFTLPDGRMAFIVADVSGKGVPAAMFMMKAMGTVKSSLCGDADLASTVAAVNDRLADNNDAEMFVTVWIGVYDAAGRVVEYVNAGHNPPLVRRAGGASEWLRKRGGPALGVFSGEKYRVERVGLSPGDSLLLYTDGVTESQDVSGDFYGEARLERFLKSSGGGLVDGVFADVADFAGEAEQADDITALVLDVKQ